MATSQEKISVYSLADLRNTSDDAIPAYLNSLKFKQSHVLSDVRLGLGYTAFAICAATFYWDYKLGFESTKFYTAIAVALYTILNGVLTFWILVVENGTVYTGTNPQGDKIHIKSKSEKYIPIYNLTITTYTKDHPKVPNTISLKKSFAGWFDKAGHFVALPFQQMFASNVPVIGAADPTKVVESKKKKVIRAGGPEDEPQTMDEKWTALLAESSGIDVRNEITPALPKGGKKRAKKA